MNRERFNKIADTIYDRFADLPDRFEITDVCAEIRQELESESVNGDLLDEFADLLTKSVDKRRTKRAESQQLDLLTGEVEALDAVWKLGSGKRVAARRANRTDLLVWLGIRGKNAERVADAYRKDRFTVGELLTYMPDDLTTVEAAVEARKQAKAGEQDAA